MDDTCFSDNCLRPLFRVESAKQIHLLSRGISPLIPAEQADDRSVSAPLCRADTDSPLFFMRQSDGNGLPVRFYLIVIRSAGRMANLYPFVCFLQNGLNAGGCQQTHVH